MPRYFFDVYEGEKHTPDHIGLELEDTQAAQQEAIRALPGIAKDCLPDGTQRDFVIEIRDEAKCSILRAKLSLTVVTLLDV
jgi:hypothetical protein